MFPDECGSTDPKQDNPAQKIVTSELAEFEKWIRVFDGCMERMAVKFQAFYLTGPEYPNLTVSFELSAERFDKLKQECAENIDPVFLDSKEKLTLVFSEVEYVFIRNDKIKTKT